MTGGGSSGIGASGRGFPWQGPSLMCIPGGPCAPNSLVPLQCHQGLVQPLPPEAPVWEPSKHGELWQQGAEVRGAGGWEGSAGTGRGPRLGPRDSCSPLSRLHEDWESFVRDLRAQLERIYFPDTVEEWMEENVNPYLDQLRDLVRDYRAIIRLNGRPKAR